MPEIAWRIQARGPFCPCRRHIARRKLVICRQRVCRSILMITNGLTPVFGSKPLSWGTFRVLFDPQVRSLYPVSALLAILLKSTPACSKTLPWMLVADRPAGVWVSFCPARPLFVCLGVRGELFLVVGALSRQPNQWR